MNNPYVIRVLEQVKEKYSYQKEYIQAVEEVLSSIEVIFDKHPEYEKLAVLERLVNPERLVAFKVPVEMDDHHVEVYDGYRVQFNGALGPYKGGIRFNKNVNESVMKFLGFEQTFKNALTTLPMGGGKGGSNFDPAGKSEGEVRRFCESFMNELYRYIGPDQDVPAGDMGVGGREIGYMYGQLRRLTGKAELGTLTGKGLTYGGALARTEATGFGLVYFVQEVLKRNPIEKPRVIVSGFGNVAYHAALKAVQSGYKLVGISDIDGYVYDENMDFEILKEIKSHNGMLAEYKEKKPEAHYATGSIYDYDIKADIVLPCATQNEIDLARAQRLVKNGVKYVIEGANMPNNNEAIAYYKQQGIIFVPGKASNAGGVSTSCIEMNQNAQHAVFTFEEVDAKLHQIMISIHQQCLDMMKQYNLDSKDYVTAANLAAANKVITAMLAQGIY